MAMTLSGFACQSNLWTTRGGPARYRASLLTFCQSHRRGKATLRHTSLAAYWTSARSMTMKFARAATARYAVASS
eukprot:477921-Heterocapsa_arctica.AAC.1